MKNPEAKLDELRRSSLIEFEHLKKDEHPDPPLRALPEHSTEDKTASDEATEGSAKAPELDGAKDSTKTEAVPDISSKDFAASEPASGGDQVQAGETTFTVPVFDDDSPSLKAEGQVLSPTQANE